MTGTEILALARIMARVSTTGVSDADGLILINSALRRISQETGGVWFEAYPELTAYFDLDTHFYFNITITGGANALVATDVAVTNSEAMDQTGAQTATKLQSQIRATTTLPSLTVVWDTDEHHFVIDSIDGDDITIGPPVGKDDQVDYTEEIFGKTDTQTKAGDATWTGVTPIEALLEVPLPADSAKLNIVEWDGRPLINQPWSRALSPGFGGSPTFWAMRPDSERMRIWPVPQSQSKLYVSGNKELTELGAASQTPEIDSETHDLIMWRVAAMLCKAIQKDARALEIMATEYRLALGEYTAHRGNRDHSVLKMNESGVSGPVTIVAGVDTS